MGSGFIYDGSVAGVDLIGKGEFPEIHCCLFKSGREAHADGVVIVHLDFVGIVGQKIRFGEGKSCHVILKGYPHSLTASQKMKRHIACHSVLLVGVAPLVAVVEGGTGTI